MKGGGDLQGSSSLFYSMLLCFSERLMNMDSLELEHFSLPVVSLRCFLLCTGFQNWVCCIELGSCLNTFLSAHAVSPTTAMHMKRPSSFTMTTFPERGELLVYKGNFSFSWSARVWHSSEGLLRLYDESLLVFGSNENFSYSFLVLHHNPSVLPSHAFTSSVFLTIAPLFLAESQISECRTILNHAAALW